MTLAELTTLALLCLEAFTGMRKYYSSTNFHYTDTNLTKTVHKHMLQYLPVFRYILQFTNRHMTHIIAATTAVAQS
jgi:hypothetical protein